jgi:processive 1,2-diacylglycerol beta-glucosyltransferase
MIIVRPIPGQEASNAAYLSVKEAAIRVDNVKDIGPVIEELLDNPEKLRRLAEHAASIAKPDAAMDIARLLLDLCHKK